jgi:hypothetical protein
MSYILGAGEVTQKKYNNQPQPQNGGQGSQFRLSGLSYGTFREKEQKSSAPQTTGS